MKIIYFLTGLILVLLFPEISMAQTTADEVQKLHTVLEKLYDEMIPLCSQIIKVSQALAGFGATFYIGYRVWKHIANAEPIDFFPLFRPFVLALLIGIFPSVLSFINGVLKPTVIVTGNMVSNSNDAIKNLLAEREAAIKSSKSWQVLVGESGTGDRQEWYKYTHPNATSGEGILDKVGNDYKFAMERMSYNIKFYIKLWISQVLAIIYYAASLCIDTIRTFHLVVLAILGPLVFGMSVFDGFQHTLSVWLARYINIFMWLPVANLFGSIINRIQENMIKIDISQLQSGGDTVFTSTDAAYLIFMIIGIVGYFTIPSVANYIVHASGGNALVSKITNLTMSTAGMAVSTTTGALGGAGSMVSDLIVMDDRMGSSLSDAKNSEPYYKDTASGFQHDKLSG